MATKKSLLVFWAVIATFVFFAFPVYAVSISDLRIIASDGTFLGTFEDGYSQNSIYNEV
ncbi:MAG: hypothetical protein LBS48_00220 [Treponema sp.]|jgi:hypothetical protein|nr:hypothetical protein [Treponema sp.]